MNILVETKSKTDIGEQRQGIADVADGELFHGSGLLIDEE
jgi:hypothetical protein